MKCPYCAEDIQDAAVLCRFCGARRGGDHWTAPQPSARRTSNFTIASTGWLLLVSGAWSLATVTSPVFVFGGFAGVPAVLYNATLSVLFGAMGFALVRRTPWALRITLATSFAYSVDKLAFALDESAQKSALGELGSMLDGGAPIVQQVAQMTALFFLIGWWAFVYYLYVKRDYFEVASGT